MKLIDLLSDYFSRRSVRAYGLSRAECGVAFVQDMNGTVRTVCFTEGCNRKDDLLAIQSRLRLASGVWTLRAFNVKERNSARILSGKEAAISIIRLSKECIPEEKIALIVLPQAEDFEYALVDSRDVLAAIAEAEATQAAGNPAQEETPEKLEPETEVASESPEVPGSPEVPERKPARRIGKSPALSAPYGLPDSAVVEDKHPAVRTVEVPDGYADLLEVLVGAFEQASAGKGKERHASNLPFIEQPMQTLSDALQDDAGMAFQAMKKIRESRGLSLDAAIRELHGAINYAAGMVLWRQKRGK